MSDRRIIEDETDMAWLCRELKRCNQALIDPRTREDEKDSWHIRLSRINNRLEYLERRDEASADHTDYPADIIDTAKRVWAELLTVRHPAGDREAWLDVESIADALLEERKAGAK